MSLTQTLTAARVVRALEPKRGVLKGKKLFRGFRSRRHKGSVGPDTGQEVTYQAPRFPVPGVKGEKSSQGGKSVFSQIINRLRARSNRNTCLLKETKGYMEFQDHKLFYKVFHPPKSRQTVKTPIVVLHGGPQMPHDYLENVGQLAFLGHPVIMFDQSGCGLSGSPSDSTMISIQYLRDQVAFVIDELSLGDVHLLGHSAGGILAMEFFLAYPESVASLILCSTPCDVGMFMQEAAELTEQLPPGVRHAINAPWECSGEEHRRAMDVFNKRFLCRLDKWPDSLLKSVEMMGTSFRGVGAISDWRISPESLARIDIPVLNISGGHDEVTPRCIWPIHSGIPSSEWIVFENSAHMPFLEEPGKFINAMARFLGRTEPSLSYSNHFASAYAG